MFSNSEILEIYQQIIREEYQQDSTTRTETKNIEKQETLKQAEIQNNENWNTTHPNTTKQTLTQEEKMNIELMKKIITEKKTTLPSLRKQDRKKSHGRNRKGWQIITIYPNLQHHGIKWADLYESEISRW